jgi:hypothetical protein
VAAGRYASCRQEAEARLVRTGKAGRFDRAINRCEETFAARWQRIIDRAAAVGATCPDSPLTEPQFKTVIDEHSANMTTALGGGGLVDNRECQSDLAMCLAQGPPEARVLRTGQTFCYASDGSNLECAGTGQDGELQKGMVRSYTDNGDGTITDNATGLMWEAKDQSGGIHDWTGAYTWDQAFSLFIAGLNTPPCFAGHCDWRLPNMNELQSLVDHSVFNPSIDPLFNANCAANTTGNPGCTVDGAGMTEKCSCTVYNWYWSSTSYVANPSYAWLVEFSTGGVGLPCCGYTKGYGFYVRAVRGGL